MSYTGSNPHLDSIVSSGDTLANLTARTRDEGALVYATDTQLYYYDDGTSLLPIDTDTTGFDAIDTKANLDALPRVQGKLYYASDEDKSYTDDGATLTELGSGAGGGVPLMALGSLLTSDGVDNGELDVGADGEILVSNSAAVNGAGVEWQAPAGGAAEVGSIVTYGGSVAPSGYLIPDGSVISRVTYASLYAVVGDAFGNGDGATTFALPDLRGRFLRMTDGAAGNDPNAGTRIASGTGGNTGDNVGSYQGDENKSHGHGIHNFLKNHDGGAVWNNTSGITSGGDSDSPPNSIVTTLVGGNESRPKNINVNYIIKY